jgi:hypothetical protein
MHQQSCVSPLLLCFDVKNGQILGPTSFNIMHVSAEKNKKISQG